jgi:hypothetical protein
MIFRRAVLTSSEESSLITISEAMAPTRAEPVGR